MKNENISKNTLKETTKRMEEKRVYNNTVGSDCYGLQAPKEICSL